MDAMRRAEPWLLVSLLVGMGCGPSAPGWEIVARDLPDAPLSVAGTSATNVWAVGADHGDGPLVLHWDAGAWSRVRTGSSGTLWWVHAFDARTLYLGGESGTILRTSDGGATFEAMTTPGDATDTVFGVWGTRPDDAYAVGSVSGRDGFLWHYDGARWSPVAIADPGPRDPSGSTPGLFKVWGDGSGHVYVVGGRGVLLRSTDGADFVRLETGTSATLFTVTGDATHAIAVGGLSAGVILEIPHDGAPVDVTPLGAGLVQGVATREGVAFASGAMGAVFERDAAWSPIETGLALDVASLHATWIDPDGGVWAVGGGVLSDALDRGAIVHHGAHVAAYEGAP